VENTKKQLVCFDLGGVMVKMAKSWSESLRWAGLGDYARPELDVSVHTFEPYVLHEIGKMTDTDYLSLLRDYLGVPTTATALQAHLGFLGDAYSGTEELVNACHEHGYQTACLSNTDHWHWAKMTSSQYPAIQSIQIKTASCLFSARKPNPDIFDAFEKFVNLRGDNIVFFDDTPMHVLGASQFGWSAHVVDDASDPAGQIRKIIRLDE
jgi:putative hydrolase of the HAD superfamily